MEIQSICPRLPLGRWNIRPLYNPRNILRITLLVKKLEMNPLVKCTNTGVHLAQTRWHRLTLKDVPFTPVNTEKKLNHLPINILRIFGLLNPTGLIPLAMVPTYRIILPLAARIPTI